MSAKPPDRLYRSDRMNYIVNRMRVDKDATPAILATELNVSPRTVYRDIQTLEQGNALVKRFSRREGRYLLENELTLSPVKLTSSEALALHHAANNPALSSSGFFAEDLHSGLEKIRRVLGLEREPSEDEADTESDETNGKPFQAESVGDFQNAAASAVQEGTRQISPLSLDSIVRPMVELLRRGVESNRCARLVYRSQEMTGEAEIIVAPLHLRETEQGWYLLANSEAHGGIRPFRVERLRHVSLVDQRFRFPRRFDPDTAFERAWQAHGCDDDDVMVELRMLPALAPLVASYASHPFLKIQTQSDGTLLCTACVPHANDMLWWILAHGSGVEVLSPMELRNEVARVAQETAHLYAAPAGTQPLSSFDTALNSEASADSPDTRPTRVETPDASLPTQIVVSSALLDKANAMQEETLLNEALLTTQAVVTANSTTSSLS